MGKFVAEQTVKCLVMQGRPVNGSKVVDIIRELQSFGVEVSVHDPRVNAEDARHEYGIDLAKWDALPKGRRAGPRGGARRIPLHAARPMLAKAIGACCVIDVKSALDRDALVARGLKVWRL